MVRASIERGITEDHERSSPASMQLQLRQIQAPHDGPRKYGRPQILPGAKYLQTAPENPWPEITS